MIIWMDLWLVMNIAHVYLVMSRYASNTGCSAALVQHHLSHGAQNHITVLNSKMEYTQKRT